ncbi:MAG: Glu-tRNA(Gln) amidotransferase subunit GatE [Candidatus Aenigmatarchaeota archaeon]
MAKEPKFDYEKLGLKFGIEIHQRLATSHKLFCGCDARISSDAPSKTVIRKMRIVAGEMGEIDPAASYEFLRNRFFVYKFFPKATCLVEQDDEPPHEINQEALDVALTMALMMRCDIPKEVQVMRKTVIDGSNTAGFQRTAVVGLNGSMKFKKDKVRIQSISIEEESAGIVESDANSVTYRLDRLGIPLVEITTEALKGNPEDAEEIAYQIGTLLRSTGKCMRGIGTIRQDLNVSVAGGDKVEIKGVQSLDLVQKAIENEASRQKRLLEIKGELKSRGCKLELFERPKDVTEIFAETKSKFLQKALQNNDRVFAVKLPKFNGLLKMELCEGKTFGKELSEYAGAYGAGIIHSDEDLKKYNIEEEFEKLKANIDAEPDDCVAIVAGSQHRAAKACMSIVERCKTAFIVGVPREVRVSNVDGTSKFLRPMPGSARMYPETDVPPRKINDETIDYLKNHLPESWDVKRKNFLRMGLGADLTDQIIRSEYLTDFEKLVKTTKVSPNLIASVLISTIKELRRDSVEVDNITESHFADIFRMVEEKRIGKEAIRKILIEISNNPADTASNLVQKLGLASITKDELARVVVDVIGKNMEMVKKEKLHATKILMGLVMSQVRGKIDGKVVSEMLKKELKKAKF